MKRILLFIASAAAFGLATAHAATLVPGSQINRVWPMTNVNGQSGLQVLGTYSGTNLYAVKSITGAYVHVGTTFAGAGLVDCDTAGSSKLLWDASTKRFSCGADQGSQWSNTGSLQAAFDSRYANTSGDTFTGALKVRGSLSGSTLTVDTLRLCPNLQTDSSGALSCNNTAYLTTEQPSVNTGGVLTIGDARYLQTERPSVNTGGVIQIGDARYIQAEMPSVNTGGVLSLTSVKYVSKQGDTMTGALTIDITGGNVNTVGLKVLNTLSGASIHAERQLTVSGATILTARAATDKTLIVRGAASQSANLTEWQNSAGTALAFVNNSGALTLRPGDQVREALNAAGTMSGRSLSISGTGSSPLLFTSVSTGRVGIGTASPSTLLHVKGSANGTNGIYVEETSGTQLQLSAGGTKAIITTSDTDAITMQTNGGRVDIEGAASIDSTTFTVDSVNNRVGVGTASPAWPFHVHTSAASDIRFAVTNGASGVTASDGFQVGINMNAGVAEGLIMQKENAPIDFYTNNAFRLRIAANGNVGIGTDTPGVLFQVRKDQNTGTEARFTNETTGTNAYTRMLFGNHTANTDLFFTSYNTGFSGNGLLGIAGAGLGEFAVNNGAGVTGMAVGTRGAHPFMISTSATERLRVLSDGNVGIGTTTPGSRLSVSGAVIINPNGNLGSTAADSGLALEIIGTASGRTIYAQQSLRSSGSLVWEGAASGATLVVSGSFSGVGLSDCDNATTSKLLWDVTTGRFSCGSDQAGGAGSAPPSVNSGGVLTLSDPRYVNTAGDTMTGNLLVRATISGSTLRVDDLKNCDTINTNVNGELVCGSDADTNTTYTFGQGLTTNGTNARLSDSFSGVTLKILGTMSGAYVHAEKGLSSSGTLVWDGAGSGAILTVSGSFDGVGLVDCDTAGTSKILWDASTKRFSCGTDTDTNTTYTAGQGLQLSGTAFSILAAHSGSVIKATTTLASSGTLVWETAASGATLTVSGAFDGAGLSDCDTAATSKLLWDASTKRFSCGTDQNSGGGSAWSNTGALQAAFDSRYVNTSGDTMTGTFVIQNGSTHSATLTPLLNVRGTMSGRGLYVTGTGANPLLFAGGGRIGIGTSSVPTANLLQIGARGTSTQIAMNKWEIKDDNSNVSFRNTNAGAFLFYNTVGSSDTSLGMRFHVTTSDSAAIDILNNTNVRFYGSVGIGTSSPDTSLEVIGTASGRVVHAQNQLRSSGSLVVEGSMSGATVYGKRCPVPILISDLSATGSTIATGSGKFTLPVPRYLSGYSLSFFKATVDTAGVTGLTRMSVRDISKGKRQMFTTNPSIDTGETSTETAATPWVINGSNDDVSGNSVLSIDLLQTQTTAPKGWDVELEFSCP